MQVLFQRYEYLIRIDRLDQVVGNLVAYGLIHNILFLAFRNHYYGDMRLALLDGREGLEAGQSGHIFVENNQVKMPCSAHIQRIASAHCGGHVIAFAVKEQQVRLQKVYLVIRP